MDINVIMDLISNYCFPIVVCIALFWKLNRDEERHEDEVAALRESLDNNTKVLTAIYEKLDGEK